MIAGRRVTEPICHRANRHPRPWVFKGFLGRVWAATLVILFWATAAFADILIIPPASKSIQ
jgi:hypothetical protein